MGQCACKKRRRNFTDDDPSYEPTSARSGASGSSRARHSRGSRWANNAHGTRRSGRSSSSSSSHHSHFCPQRSSLNVDVKELILETLTVIRTLVNNEQEPPPSMLKLNLIADKESGWLMIVQSMIELIPPDNPLGPAVFTLFLDESPLPTKDTVCKLLFHLNLNSDLSRSNERSSAWHRNVCIVLGCIAEKLAGPNSVATFKSTTLEYLLANLEAAKEPFVVLFSIIALEKYAQTSENKSLIARKLQACSPSPLQLLEHDWLSSQDFTRRQVGFCAQWCLDNLFVDKDRPFSYEIVDTTGINVMLNHNDVSEYLKISPNGLEDGYGIGDDGFSVAYDGCRQLLWHNAASHSHTHDNWKPGDVLGCLLDLVNYEVVFYLNGMPLRKPHVDVFANAKSGFFAAASFMSFQECEFNFGHKSFAFPPPVHGYKSFNDHAELTEDQRRILPSGFCTGCSLVLEQCPLCRRTIENRAEEECIKITELDTITEE